MRATKSRILMWTSTRSALRGISEILACLENDEADEFLTTLMEELQALKNRDPSAEIWQQATSNLSGPVSYGLERIGLWPNSEKQD